MSTDKNKKEKRDLNAVSGVAFDDLSIDEMEKIQGAGDVEGEVFTTPVCIASASAAISIYISKTFKGKC